MLMGKFAAMVMGLPEWCRLKLANLERCVCLMCRMAAVPHKAPLVWLAWLLMWALLELKNAYVGQAAATDLGKWVAACQSHLPGT